MDFDETRLYYSHQQLQNNPFDNDDVEQENRRPENNNHLLRTDDDGQGVDLTKVRNHFREFLRNYRLGNSRYIYREKLLRMHRRLQRRMTINNHNSSDGALREEQNAWNDAKLEVDLAHVGEYDATLLGSLLNQPCAILPSCERAASEALQTLLYDARRTQQQNEEDHDMEVESTMQNDAMQGDDTEENATIIHIQILLSGNLKPTPLRSIKSEHMNRLLKCPGIVISTSPVKNRAVRLTVRCSRCLDSRTVTATDGPFGGVVLPQSCQGPNPQECGRFPYAVVPDESQFVDQQTLKLQEAPERVPTGEMPRSVLLTVERSLVDKAAPGTRVSVLCVPSLFTAGGNNNAGSKGGVKSVYLRVVGMIKDNDAHGEAVTFTPAEEEAFRALSRRGDIHDILSRSIAPDISGSYTVDIKKALVCQLLGGRCKRLPDGVRLRGDINVLLLGDPSMAKSQFLKFISKVAPVGIYTSGKGSSAAGLTASVVRDAKGEFYLEGGAMVLADGGIVCIDEFDKMRPADRVAIHEAMEQQTISVAKAGITTVLNSRSSVLAAANPVFGRYDDFKSASENIDLMTTILSRFDLIFLVRDVREEERDRLICQHVMGVHINSSKNTDGGLGHLRPAGGDAGDMTGLSYMTSSNLPGEDDDATMDNNENGAAASSTEAIVDNVMSVVSTGSGELSVPALKKYIQYCKARCSPRLSEEAGEVLTSSYVKIRDDVRRQTIQASGRSGPDDDNQSVIPITVRQLEALVRISESLAKARLDAEVRPEDVTEAIRLFKVSTMAANAADQNRNDTSFAALSAPNREEMERTEAYLRSRLTVGSMVNKQRVLEEAAGQGFHAVMVARALSIMVGRGEIQERNQGRLLKRVK